MTIGRVEIAIVRERDQTLVRIDGQLDERAELLALVDQLRGKLVLDLAKVSFINSMGVRKWTELLLGLRQRCPSVTLRQCSEAMVYQMNMIIEARGDAHIESFYAPYHCDGCGHEESMCVSVPPNLAELRDQKAPELPCPQCDATMVFSEIPERYLLFLGD
jgi:anti-anti-sigma regulatory factor